MEVDSPERDRDNLTPPPRYNQYLPSRQTAVNKLTTLTAPPELPACVRQVLHGGLCCLYLARAPGALVQLYDFWSMKCFGVMVHVCDARLKIMPSVCWVKKSTENCKEDSGNRLERGDDL